MTNSPRERRAFHWVRYAGEIQPAEIVFVAGEAREVWLIGNETHVAGAEILVPIEVPQDLAGSGAGS